jgi:hypothetical protein
MPLSGGWWPFPAEAPKPKPAIEKTQRCPLCGSVGFKSFNMFECSNKSCRNYKAPPGPHYVWEPIL